MFSRHQSGPEDDGLPENVFQGIPLPALHLSPINVQARQARARVPSISEMRNVPSWEARRPLAPIGVPRTPSPQALFPGQLLSSSSPPNSANRVVWPSPPLEANPAKHRRPLPRLRKSPSSEDCYASTSTDETSPRRDQQKHASTHTKAKTSSMSESSSIECFSNESTSFNSDNVVKSSSTSLVDREIGYLQRNAARAVPVKVPVTVIKNRQPAVTKTTSMEVAFYNYKGSVHHAESNSNIALRLVRDGETSSSCSTPSETVEDHGENQRVRIHKKKKFTKKELCKTRKTSNTKHRTDTPAKLSESKYRQDRALIKSANKEITSSDESLERQHKPRKSRRDTSRNEWKHEQREHTRINDFHNQTSRLLPSPPQNSAAEERRMQEIARLKLVLEPYADFCTLPEMPDTPSSPYPEKASDNVTTTDSKETDHCNDSKKSNTKSKKDANLKEKSKTHVKVSLQFPQHMCKISSTKDKEDTKSKKDKQKEKQAEKKFKKDKKKEEKEKKKEERKSKKDKKKEEKKSKKDKKKEEKKSKKEKKKEEKRSKKEEKMSKKDGKKDKAKTRVTLRLRLPFHRPMFKITVKAKYRRYHQPSLRGILKRWIQSNVSPTIWQPVATGYNATSDTLTAGYNATCEALRPTYNAIMAETDRRMRLMGFVKPDWPENDDVEIPLGPLPEDTAHPDAKARVQEMLTDMIMNKKARLHTETSSDTAGLDNEEQPFFMDTFDYLYTHMSTFTSRAAPFMDHERLQKATPEEKEQIKRYCEFLHKRHTRRTEMSFNKVTKLRHERLSDIKYPEAAPKATSPENNTDTEETSKKATRKRKPKTAVEMLDHLFPVCPRPEADGIPSWYPDHVKEKVRAKRAADAELQKDDDLMKANICSPPEDYPGLTQVVHEAGEEVKRHGVTGKTTGAPQWSDMLKYKTPCPSLDEWPEWNNLKNAIRKTSYMTEVRKRPMLDKQEEFRKSSRIQTTLLMHKRDTKLHEDAASEIRPRIFTNEARHERIRQRWLHEKTLGKDAMMGCGGCRLQGYEMSLGDNRPHTVMYPGLRAASAKNDYDSKRIATEMDLQQLVKEGYGELMRVMV